MKSLTSKAPYKEDRGYGLLRLNPIEGTGEAEDAHEARGRLLIARHVAIARHSFSRAQLNRV